MAEDVFGVVGTVVAGAYPVERVVAEGGFGTVYRAHQGASRGPVALKLLRIPQHDPAQRAALLHLFQTEADVLCGLSVATQANVRLLRADVLTTSGGRLVPYLVMEWLDGLTLEELIQRRVVAGQPPVALRKLVRLFTPLARALEQAHRFTGPAGPHSVVHGDLKPANLFIAQVAGGEVVKVLNLGLGKLRAAASQADGRTHQDPSRPSAFTPAYGAPEQWAPRQHGQTGPWTDVWGLARCIVETLAARTIVPGDTSAMMGVALNAARRPTPRQEGVEVPDAVEAVFARALAVDPRARHRDVGAFWNELTAALQAPDTSGQRYAQGGVRGESSVGIELGELRPPAALASVPRRRASNPAVERVLAADLEFDPLSAPNRSFALQDHAHASARAHDVAPHFVPDLELGPPSVSRKPSGAQLTATVAPERTALDLDDGEGGSPGMLQLDLPSDGPISIRPMSAPRMRAEPSLGAPSSSPAPRRASGSIVAVREAARQSAASLPAISAPSELEISPSSAGSAQRDSTRPPASSLPTTGAEPLGSTLSLDLSKYERRPLSRRLRPAFASLAAAIFVALLDPIYAGATGKVLEVAGLRLSVFGGVLLLLALALGARAAFRAPDP